MRHRWGWLCLLPGLAFASPAVAQRALTGTVRDSATNAPIAGATVTIAGTRLGAYTRENGNFVIPNAPEGELTVSVRFIGYKRQTLRIGGDQDVVEIALPRDFLKLEEIVVTGQATGVEKRNLANAVSVVGEDELLRAPAQTVESALQGKVPGAYIQENSGAPGGGIQVQLRGVSTINAGADPLFVVDGIVVSNEAVPNGANAVTLAQAGGNPNNQDNPVNRIADLNPADIEKIEILKGASAAAIYGAKATNGVVIITTKRGQTGKPQFSVSQKFGIFSLARRIGQRIFNDSAEAFSVYDSSLVRQFFVPGKRVDWEDLLYGRNALSYETQASVNGGTEQTRYYIAGLVKNDEGIAINTDYKKQGLRVNLDQVLGDRFNLSVSTNIAHSVSNRGLSNNDNSGTSPGLVLPFTPSFFDPRPDPTGRFPTNPFERSNPLQTFTLLKNQEDVWRALGTITTRFTAVTTDRHRLSFAVTGGADYFSQRNDFLSPPELQFEPQDGLPGTVIQGKAQNLNLNLSVHGTHVYAPASGKVEATTSLGVQFEDRELNATSIVGRDLASGRSGPDQASSRTDDEELRKVRDFGFFGQEEVLLDQRRLLLTAGFRADRSSVNGDPNKYFVYPKVAASYRLQQLGGFVDELKLRAAYGEAGNQPVFGAKFISDTVSVMDGRLGTLVGVREGDPNIEPERSKEIEAGFDAQLGKGRAEFNFTVYQRRITNLLLDQTLAPSTGQLTRIFNSGGTLRNRGVEIGFRVIPVQTRDVYWVFGTTFSLNRSRVDLPSNVAPFQTGGFGTSLGAFEIRDGKSATRIVGLVNNGAAVGEVGDAYPDFIMGFSNDVEWRRFRLGMQWDWKQGGDVINLTKLLFDAGQNSADRSDGGLSRLVRWASGNTKVYVEDASYLKLRELSLSYDLPPSVVGAMFGAGARYARLTLSGRNLIRITPYDGYDPEVSNFGNQPIFRNIDVAPFPPSRSWFFSIDVGF